MAVLRVPKPRPETLQQKIDKNEHCTPQHILDRVKWVLGAIDLDPAWNHRSLVRANTCWTKADDSLSKDWGGFRTIYLNPPYSRDPDKGTTFLDWAAKAAETYLKYGPEIIGLYPVSVSTIAWQDHILPVATMVCWVRGRITFVGSPTGANFESAIVYYGRQKYTFREAFSEIGHIVTL